jgi:hypothetical protein
MEGKAMRARAFLRLLSVIAVIGTLPATARAQQDAATMTGVVNDAAGAAIAGASVTVVNVQTSITNKATADGNGFYTIPSLRPGSY